MAKITYLGAEHEYIEKVNFKTNIKNPEMLICI